MLVLPGSAFGTMIGFGFVRDLDRFDGAKFAANREFTAELLECLVSDLHCMRAVSEVTGVCQNAQVLGHFGITQWTEIESFVIVLVPPP